MARHIDLDDLDADDIAYIEQRAWMIQEIGLQGFDYEALKAQALGLSDDNDDEDDGEDDNVDPEDPDTGKTSESSPEPEDTSEDEEDSDEGTSEDDGEDDEDEEPEDYTGEDWTFQALKEEIDARNEGNDDADTRISKAGSADDLRARLIADDEADADSDDED